MPRMRKKKPEQASPCESYTVYAVTDFKRTGQQEIGSAKAYGDGEIHIKLNPFMVFCGLDTTIILKPNAELSGASDATGSAIG